MSRVLARAPGKVVLIGEYAVLHGAPALAMAVNRYARARFVSCQPGESRLFAPQLGIDPVAFRVDGGLQWDVDAPGWPQVRRTATLLGYLYGLAEERFGTPGAFSVEVDTADLFMDSVGGPVKLGLGSSSAVAVALDAGLRRFVGKPDEPGLSMHALERLLKPYRRGQDGQGSGIDLASCLCGGVIAYQRNGDATPEVTRLSLPDHLALMFVWSGRPASTPELLLRHQAWRTERKDEALALHAEMVQLCEAARAAMGQSDTEALVEHFHSYGGLLSTMKNGMGIDLLGAGHGRIRAEAERLGLAYKPCGAGVGDIGMVAATDPSRFNSMRRWLDEQGFPVLPLAVDAEGVHAQIEAD